MKFLGNADAQRVPDLVDALQQAAGESQPFDLSLHGFGAFPDWRRPRVLWIGAEAPGILRLQKVVEERVAPLGFPGEARPFHPHVTLGRANRDLSRRDAAELARSAERFGYSELVRIDTVELMQSDTTPSGAKYTVVASAGLGGGEG